MSTPSLQEIEKIIEGEDPRNGLAIVDGEDGCKLLATRSALPNAGAYLIVLNGPDTGPNRFPAHPKKLRADPTRAPRSGGTSSNLPVVRPRSERRADPLPHRPRPAVSVTPEDG